MSDDNVFHLVQGDKKKKTNNRSVEEVLTQLNDIFKHENVDLGGEVYCYSITIMVEDRDGNILPFMLNYGDGIYDDAIIGLATKHLNVMVKESNKGLEVVDLN